jgi:hypothetical protein
MGVDSGSRFRRSVLGLALSLLGCASTPPPVASSPVMVPPPTKAQVQTAPPTENLPRLRLEAGRVLLDEREVAPVERGKVGRVGPLFDAMKARLEAPKDNPFEAPYDLTVADDVDGAQLKSTFQTAAFSGWPMAVLDLGERSIALHAFLPLPPSSSQATTYDLVWPEDTLVLVVRADSVELWRAKTTPPATPDGEPSNEAAPVAPAPTPEVEPAKSVGSLKAENVVNGLPFLLRTVCEQGSACSPAVLYVADDAPFSLINGALRALTTLPIRSGRPDVQFRLGKPEVPGSPLRVRIGATSVSGRLPPEVIQRTVRASFDTLRQCYEAGLGRDPNLTGKVVTRFVIGRDGSVPQATAAEGTTMPDPKVSECVVAHLRGLRFPAPDGGIVTVVYPILFAPSE